ncbi:Adenylate cyclase type 10, partial [Tauraco erythrolophus]
PLLRSISLFMVLSLAPGYARTESFCRAAADNATSQEITYLQLDELKPSAVVQKVCQDLGVVSIPRDLGRFLIQRSSGTPYYCDEVLCCLRHDNVLLFCSQGLTNEAEDDWESLITRTAPQVYIVTGSFPGCRGSAAEGSTAAAFCPGAFSKRETRCFSLAEIALAQLDRMQLLKQVVLKLAAVIGSVFTTQLLSHILPAGIRHQMSCLLD